MLHPFQKFEEKKEPTNPPQLSLGLFILIVILVLGFLGPLFYPYQPDTMLQGMRLSSPTWAHPFGTDPFGRDLLSRTLHGIRIASLMGLSAAFVAISSGTFLGILAGFLKGYVDRVLSRTIDLWLSLPSLLFALIFIAKLGPSLINTTLVLGIIGIPSIYRVIRAETLRISEESYILAAISLGAPTIRIMFQHIFPNIFYTVVTLGTLRIGSVILAGSGLSFIGLGAQPPTPDLGSMLAIGRDYFIPYWWLVVFPGLTIVTIILSVQLIGDGMRKRK